MSVPDVDAEVAVVGGGPTGMVLAVLLGQLGRSVVVLERWPAPYPLPRAVHFDHEVARLLQGCGIGDELRRISEPAEVYEWRNGEGTPLLRFGRVGAGASGWPESSMFHQPALEAALAGRADALATVDVRRGVAVTAIAQDDDHVAIECADGTAIRARYAVGCDGANSTVRELLGVPVHDAGFLHDWLVVDVVLHEPRVFDPINVQVCDPARPTTAVSGGPGRRRWEFMRLPHETAADLGDEATAWRLLAAWDVTPGNATLERHAVYTFAARWADRWRDGRVLLAGDAAHQMPPFAGQGMCAGVRDAANLAWKLDLVLSGGAADVLLDTYERERMPHARAVIDISMALGEVICVPDPAAAAERDAAMASAVGNGLSEIPPLPGVEGGFVHPDADHAGRVFVQREVPGRDRAALFDDVHGAGWRLVTIDAPALPSDGAGDDDPLAWFASIGGAVVAVDETDGEAPGPYRRWFADHGATWALERPDHHLYGTAATPAAATDLLVHLRTDLRAGGRRPTDRSQEDRP